MADDLKMHDHKMGGKTQQQQEGSKGYEAPKSLIEALSEIQIVAAIERRQGRLMGQGELDVSDMFVIHQDLDFTKVGAKTALAGGFVAMLMLPVIVTFLEYHLPVFGDATPTLYDKAWLIVLAFSFHLGQSFFLAQLGPSYVGPYTKKMTDALMRGLTFATIGKAVVGGLFYIWLAVMVGNQARVLSVISWINGHIKLKQETMKSLFLFFTLDLRDVFAHTALIFIGASIVYLAIPKIAIARQEKRNNINMEEWNERQG